MSSTTVNRPHRRPSPHSAPRPTSVRIRRRWRTLWRWAARRVKWGREIFARGHRGVEKPPEWRRTWKKTAASWIVYIGALVLFALVLRALWVIVIRGKPWSFPLGFDPDTRCAKTGYSCGVTSGIAMTFLSLAFATAVFLLWRLGRVRRPFVGRARDNTREFVQNAGTIFGSVVGREELCNVIMDDLKDRTDRRPHIIVGGVGVGKTAVLVELTKVLAEHGAVPVPVRLRDAGDELDFAELARKRFISDAKRSAHTDAEAERAWRELVKDDQVVVVADGLEEALSQTANADGADGTDTKLDGSERDNRIRVAIQNAHRSRLPLVIASRPHDALVGLDAAEIELEPLGEEYALEYIEEQGATHDEKRLDWVVQTAEVTETPLYLQLAHELEGKRLLGYVGPWQDGHLDTRGGDRVGLRVGLLETYIQALIDGHFYPELPMSSVLRKATIQQLGALACAGLRADSIEVPFSSVLPEDADNRSDQPNPEAGGRHELRCVVEDAVADLVSDKGISVRDRKQFDLERELRLAAARGVRLGLVEARERGVRFPHSIMQAYLASRVLGCAVQTPAIRDGSNQAVKTPDFLDEALKESGRELLSALVMYSRRPRGPLSKIAQRALPVAYDWDDPGGIRERLTERAQELQNDAKTLDLLVAVLELDSVASHCHHRRYAGNLRAHWPPRNEDHTVEEAKLGAIARFGAVARKIDQRRRGERAGVPAPAWTALYRIACNDVWYPVRIAAAQELGAGGDHAFTQLEDHLGPRKRSLDHHKVCWKDPSGHRELVLRAWLAPMLAASVSGDCLDAAKTNLRQWVDWVDRAPRDESTAPISLEIALAQGFKYAANRRPRGSSAAEAKVRAYLAEQAAELLARRRFWFSRLTLVHALCLWALPDQDAGEQSRPEREPLRRGSDPAALIDHWLSSTDAGTEHPFVAEARELAVLALEKGQPERYIWIDEAGVVTKIGSRRPRSDAPRTHSLWIPPSTGWSALHPRAQRLVADVLILLNLAECGSDKPEEREAGLKRANRDDLPSCLTGERGYLEADRTVGTVEQLAPGARCKDGCHFDLCPYPAKGPSQIYRAELSEAFCRRQQVLLGRWFYVWPWRRTAKWQGAVPKELKRFWMAMERRARR